MTIKKIKKEPFIRINSRIEKTQHEFIKKLSKKLGITEGETHRLIIKYYMGHAQ